MSRAFVREDDGTRPEQLAEHSVSAAPNLVTARGLRRITGTIADLERALATASDPEQVARLKRDLRYWNLRHATARPVTPDPDDPTVQFGARVTYLTPEGEEKVLTITGEDEADPAAGRIAYTAPVARALTGTAPGDVASLRLGGSPVELKVLRVEIPDDPSPL